ncbi:hypothetical protein BV25DRAFT_1922822 [Artomyces pyxidatus]|uniref:Uncharacterized protein n=1 Tax=Artomyces pyxidatus TaxID=48021 RepID=A0ACB8SD91_9AGAM|nr:hypothetical protein BV25DRAFT_1922822 [Artomyces pyxidatus]
MVSGMRLLSAKIDNAKGYLERAETPEWFEEQVKRASMAAEDATMQAGGLEQSAVYEL